MKKLFIALCDILAISAAVALGALVVWGIATMFNLSAADTAKAVFIVAAIIVVIDTVLSYIVWDNGGELDDTEEGDK